MNSYIQPSSIYQQKKFNTLKRFINKQKTKDLKKRLKADTNMSDMEYISGAFLEMYEPYLKDIVCKLFDKGYSIETSSGFNNLASQYQSLVGNFTLDYVTRNKLDKEGIKIRDNDGNKSLVFWAEKPDLDYIRQKWLKIIDFLPDKGNLRSPSERPNALLFRRKYNSKNPKLQKLRLFENLEYKTRQLVENKVLKRKKINPKPSKIESGLGIFTEELEPQVSQAVLTMNKKGYSTDLSGFVKNSCDQMIEGDFQLPEAIAEKLKNIDVDVQSNPSGYTRLQFTPQDADIGKIKKKWNEIVSLLPSKNKSAEFSMTQKARQFRIKYS